MADAPHCPLCGSISTKRLIFKKSDSSYFRCGVCELKFLSPSMRLETQEEKERYQLHENHFEDQAYQNFLKPLFDVITGRHEKGHCGLDFGAGSGPVLSKMLEDFGYKMNLYDPYFWPDTSPLAKKFDFIVSSEVFEHLYSPFSEITRLKSCLKPAGTLGIMTSLTDDVDFEDWYYRRDPTHVCFYSCRTMLWIKEHFQFSRMVVENKRTVWFES